MFNWNKEFCGECGEKQICPCCGMCSRDECNEACLCCVHCGDPTCFDGCFATFLYPEHNIEVVTGHFDYEDEEEVSELLDAAEEEYPNEFDIYCDGPE